jgi:hypothetical protein
MMLEKTHLSYSRGQAGGRQGCMGIRKKYLIILFQGPGQALTNAGDPRNVEIIWKIQYHFRC